jgi:hypothetical protein
MAAKPYPLFWHSIQRSNAAGPRGGHMNNEAVKEVLNELFSHLERLETQSEAILQFLKEKNRVIDKQLAPIWNRREMPAM